MAYINYRKNNPSYSPGLSTYGSSSVEQKGEKGPKGKNGTSLYFINSTISDGADEINNLIREGLSFEAANSKEVVEYMIGDIVIDDSGNVYRIEEIQTGGITYLGINVNKKIGDITPHIRQYFYTETNSLGTHIILASGISGIEYDLITDNGIVRYNVGTGASIKLTGNGWEYNGTDIIEFIQERDNNGNILIFKVPNATSL